MRRILRADRSIDLLQTRVTSPYLCKACKQRANPFSTSAIRRAAPGDKLPFTEKLRRTIWGTDKPPGLDDPYGGQSHLERNAQANKERAAAEEDKQKGAVKAAPDLGDYEPALTSDGLEKVGGYGGWWKANWDPEHRYKAFTPAEVSDDPHEITVALHRAIVEAFALQHAGKSLADISSSEPGPDLTHDVQLRPTETGAAMEFPDETSFDNIVLSLAAVPENSNPTESEEDVAAEKSPVDPLQPEPYTEVHDETAVHENPTESEEDITADRSEVDVLSNTTSVHYESLVASWDPSWLQVPLDNPEIKFAVLKRTLQLTGIRLSDSAIQPSRTVHALLSRLITPPKPRKLFDALIQKEGLASLPNVEIYAQRITPIDKERAVGRWKIIEKELEERGLPVTGN